MKLPFKPTGQNVQFELSTQPGSQVVVAGTFNRWSLTAHPLKDNPGPGHFKASLRIPTGRHEYKFVVNGNWIPDPTCAEQTPDGHGSWNSVLHV